MQLTHFSTFSVRAIWGALLMRGMLYLDPTEAGKYFDGVASSTEKVHEVYMALDFVGCFDLFFTFLLHLHRKIKGH